jgi:RimJ/RimL family protein N-acetyltransferase
MMKLSLIARVEGPNLILRLIKPDDAAYVHGLRSNPAYNTHLSTVTGTVDDQRTWIEDYKSREAQGQEFYYVIERKDGMRCGLVRLYDFDVESFTWGSWILDESKPRKAALESAVLIYQIGFLGHNLDSAIFEVLNENSHTLAFHRRFGALETGHDELNTYFKYARARFEKDKMAHFSILESENRDV